MAHSRLFMSYRLANILKFYHVASLATILDT